MLFNAAAFFGLHWLGDVATLNKVTFLLDFNTNTVEVCLNHCLGKNYWSKALMADKKRICSTGGYQISSLNPKPITVYYSCCDKKNATWMIFCKSKMTCKTQQCMSDIRVTLCK